MTNKLSNVELTKEIIEKQGVRIEPVEFGCVESILRIVKTSELLVKDEVLLYEFESLSKNLSIIRPNNYNAEDIAEDLYPIARGTKEIKRLRALKDGKEVDINVLTTDGIEKEKEHFVLNVDGLYYDPHIHNKPIMESLYKKLMLALNPGNECIEYTTTTK